MKRYITCISMLILLALPGITYALGIEAAISGWNASPEGNFSYTARNDADTLDLKHDLKYDSAWLMSGRVKVDIPLLPGVYVMASPMKFEGTGLKSTSFIFKNITFSPNYDIKSSLEINMYDVGIYFGIPFLKLSTAGILNIDFGLNARILDIQARIDQHLSELSASKGYLTGVPLAYAAAQIRPIDMFAIEAEARGISYSKNHFFSLIGRVKVFPYGPLFIAGGYRYESINLDQSNIVIDTLFTGPFAEAGVQF